MSFVRKVETQNVDTKKKRKKGSEILSDFDH